MELGAFSISLAVRDLAASRAFYEKLGFAAFAGDPAQNWLIMKNGVACVGLFQGMLERNTLTFNPGWDQDAKRLACFDDVRDIQARLQAQGLTLERAVDHGTTGPGHVVVVDPDGNPVLIDQHV